MKKILIVGANSFIARRFMASLEKLPWDIYKTVRSNNEESDRKTFSLDLCEINEKKIKDLPDVDVVVYFSWSFDSRVNNARAYEEMFKLMSLKCQSQIFISTISANSYNSTRYGQEKLAAERLLRFYPHKIVRPGLVIGNGGLVARILNFVNRFPVLPTFDRFVVVPVVCIQDLVDQMIQFLSRDSIELNVFHQNQPSFSQLLQAIAKSQKKQVILIPVPKKIMKIIVVLLNKVGISQIGSNLQSLLDNQNSNITSSVSLKPSMIDAYLDRSLKSNSS